MTADKVRTRGIIAVSFVAQLYKGGNLVEAHREATRLLDDSRLPEFATRQLKEVLGLIDDALSKSIASHYPMERATEVDAVADRKLLSAARARFDVVLEAAVLAPGTLRDTLLATADLELYRPWWTKHILDELESTLVGHIGLSQWAAHGIREKLTESFPESCVTGYEDLIPAMKNSERDRHVLAAAVRMNAATIVTESPENFATEAVARYAVKIRTVDKFLISLLSVDTSATVHAVQTLLGPREQRMSFASYLERIRKSAPKFAEELRKEVS